MIGCSLVVQDGHWYVYIWLFLGRYTVNPRGGIRRVPVYKVDKWQTQEKGKEAEITESLRSLIVMVDKSNRSKSRRRGELCHLLGCRSCRLRGEAERAQCCAQPSPALLISDMAYLNEKAFWQNLITNSVRYFYISLSSLSDFLLCRPLKTPSSTAISLTPTKKPLFLQLELLHTCSAHTRSQCA